MFAEMLVASMCATYSANLDQTACQKAGQAFSTQTGATATEKMFNDYAMKEGKGFLGESTVDVGGTLGYIGVKGIRDKSLDYKLNTSKWNILNIDFIKPQITYKPDNFGSSVGIGWKW